MNFFQEGARQIGQDVEKIQNLKIGSIPSSLEIFLLVFAARHTLNSASPSNVQITLLMHFFFQRLAPGISLLRAHWQHLGCKHFEDGASFCFLDQDLIPRHTVSTKTSLMTSRVTFIYESVRILVFESGQHMTIVSVYVCIYECFYF